MFGCPFSSFSKQGILLILLSNLHYGVGVSSYLSFHKTVGDSVEIPAGLEGQNATIMQWKYRGKDIAEFNSEVVYSRGSQFDGRLELNVINFSLTIRKLTLQDSGEFLVTAETDKQIPTKAVTLQVHGQAWYSIYIGVSVGGAVVLILTVAVAVCYCRKHRNKADLTDNTIYADVMINTRSRDTRSNSHVNPISIYETVNDLVIPRLNKPQTLYDKITFGRREAHPSPFQEVL
uniref:Immunoglobulin V-set domain-containing protein n=1 Tax=Oncorhynchus tshawytscha TaxID=74940 RepID=A0A8C8H8Y8_ONCTS